MASFPDWEERIKKRDWLWGSVVNVNKEPGSILALTYQDIPQDAFLFTAGDLPGNQWINFADGRFPLLADRVLNWKGQAVGLIVSSNYHECISLGKTISPIVIPEKSLDWDKSGEILHTRSVSRNPEEGPFHSTLKTVVKIPQKFTWQSQPCEILALYKSGELFIQTPGPWPTAIRESAPRILGLNPEKIFIQIAGLKVPAVTGHFFLSIACLYAGILAILTGRPIRFQLNEAWNAAWPMKMPETSTVLTGGLDKDKNLKCLTVETQVHAGKEGVFIQEWADRFTYYFVRYFPNLCLNLKTQVYSSHQAPRSPGNGWGEASAAFALQEFLFQLEKLQSADSFRPLPQLPPILSELGQVLEHNTYWTRYWGAYKTQNRGMLLNRRGLGVGYGYSNAGFLSSETASCTIVLRKEKEKKIRLFCPMPLSDALQKLIKTTLEKEINDPSISIVHEKWYGLDCPEVGPAVLGRPFEILPKLAQRAMKLLMKKKEFLNGKCNQTAIFRGPSSKSWTKETFSGEPFLSTTSITTYIDLTYDSLVEIFTPLTLHIVIDCGEVSNEREVNHNIRQSVIQIMFWMWGDEYTPWMTGKLPKITVEFLRRPGKIQPKAIHNTLWASLPFALFQACRNANPKWNPPLFTESIYEN